MLDGVELRGIPWLKHDGRARGLNRGDRVRVLVDAQVVHDDDVARAQHGGQMVPDIRLKASDSEPLVEDRERCPPIQRDRPHERPPRAVSGRVERHALACGRATVGMMERCADRGLVNKHQLMLA